MSGPHFSEYMSNQPRCDECGEVLQWIQLRPCGHSHPCLNCVRELLQRSQPCPDCGAAIDGAETMGHSEGRAAAETPHPQAAATSVQQPFGGAVRITTAELKQLSTFDFDALIDQGGFGAVFCGDWRGQPAAIKRPRRKFAGADRDAFLAEVATLIQLKHPYLIAPLAYCDDVGSEAIVFPRYEPLEEASLQTLPEETIVLIIAHVAAALSYLHSKGHVHRDVKPQNILIHKGLDGEVIRAVLCDVGLLRVVEGTHRSTDCGGTVGFIDPEVLRTGQCRCADDVYSLGVTMACLFERKMFLSEHTGSPMAVEDYVRQRVPTRFADLVTQMVGEVTARPTAAFVAGACVGGPVILALLQHAFPVSPLPPALAVPLTRNTVVGVSSSAAAPPSSLPRTEPFTSNLSTVGLPSPTSQVAASPPPPPPPPRPEIDADTPVMQLNRELWRGRETTEFASLFEQVHVVACLSGVHQTEFDAILSKMTFIELNLFGSAGIYHLRSIDCRFLTSLILCETIVTQSGIAGLEAPLLKKLKLSKCVSITDVSGLLRGCLTLECLSLDGTRVGQAGIAGVEAPMLETLNLSGCIGITDVSGLLRGCRTLEALNLSRTSVGQAGIAGVEAPRLRELLLENCRGITDITAMLRGCDALLQLFLRGSGVVDQTNVWNGY